MTPLLRANSNGCWFSRLPGADPCEGRLVRCHLIPRQVLRREHPLRHEPGHVNLVLHNPATWVWGCGGAMGPGGHHGKYKPDGPRPIPRHLLPPGLEEFAAELGLGWWLDRTYGPLEVVA